MQPEEGGLLSLMMMEDHTHTATMMLTTGISESSTVYHLRSGHVVPGGVRQVSASVSIPAREKIVPVR